jgi:hypothetical protein
MKAALLAMLMAYIMPASGVLKRFAGQRDDLSTSALKATGVAIVAPAVAKDVAALLGVPWNSGDLNLNVTLAVRLPGRCRVELSSAESTKVLAVSWSGAKPHTEGGEVPALTVALEQACALLSLKSGEDGATREALAQRLSTLKVDLRQVSLARSASGVNGVSYLIGQRAEGQPQLWVYKDRFLPSRLRFNDAATQWDVRFSNYGSQATGDVWPRVIEVIKGSEAHLRVMLLSADLKADLSGVKF